MFNKELMVSVKMITYKHEPYIRQAIEGVLMQQLDFEFDLIIADDCSPDNTYEIVNNIIGNHPKGYRIKYFRHGKNIGILANSIYALNQCKGKYVGICEGDDYWTDPLKLQKQVEFLENNKDFSVCGTYTQILNNDGLSQQQQNITHETINHYDIVLGKSIPTLSLLFRNIKLDFRRYEENPFFMDQYILLLLTKDGSLGAKLSFYSAVYRYHGTGINSGNTYSKNVKTSLGVKFNFIKLHYDKKAIAAFNKFLNKFFWNHLRYLHHKEFFKAFLITIRFYISFLVWNFKNKFC